MVNVGPLGAEIVIFVYVEQRVEQRVPPVFGRAAITLGIGPHSSS